MRRPLIIDERGRQDIASVVSYAENHRVDIRSILRCIQGKESPIGDNPRHVCFLPCGFRVVYSIEQQSDGDWYRHISISINHPDRCPAPDAVRLISQEFGFQNALEDNMYWLEKCVTAEYSPAVNVLEPIKK